MDNLPWIEKYRPKHLSDIISQSESINILNNTIKTGELPHLLLYGGPGTGKTSSIIALCNQLFGSTVKDRVIELNASDERGINIIRTKIIPFAKTAIGSKDHRTLCPDYKIIILDEADAMTKEAQTALRKVMEDTSSITRFCFICNYINQIILPINSRCVKIRFKPISDSDIKSKITEISKKEKININESGIDALVEIASGDLRKGILLLQNIKYLNKENISDVDIYDNCRFISTKRFTEYMDLLKIKEFSEVISIITSDCYTIQSILNRSVEYVTLHIPHSEKKIQFLFELSDIDKKINDNADEYIQLVKLFLWINHILP